jgi:hypothetical protein
MSLENEKSGRLRPVLGVVLGNLLFFLPVFVSLVLNVVVINQLLLLRSATREAILETNAMLADLQNETIVMTVPVNETIALDVDIPVNETITVPIQTEIPISTSATVYVDSGILGGVPVSFPVYTNVPIDIMVDIPLDQTFEVHDSLLLDMEIPVEIALADTPFSDALIQAQMSLDDLATELEGNPFALK